MSSLARMLGILDLFEQAPLLGADDIIERLDYSRPTGYRYIRELVSAGLLVRGAGGYALGPRIIELDWLIRKNDGLLLRSRPIVRDLVARTGCSVTQMTLHGERIVTIHHEPGPEPLEIAFDRGRRLPLFRGAPSRAILAFLPRARLLRLFERHRAELSDSQKRRGFATFHQRLQETRRAGHAISVGELDPDKAGIAAPVFGPERRVIGSICVVMTITCFETSNVDLLCTRVTEVASAISHVAASEL